MTTQHDKTSAHLQPTVFNPLYMISNNSPAFSVKEPDAEYDANDLQTLRDKLEEHLARYHFHQQSLLAIATSEDYQNSENWEFGAYLVGRDLQQQSDALMKALSQYQSNTTTQ